MPRTIAIAAVLLVSFVAGLVAAVRWAAQEDADVPKRGAIDVAVRSVDEIEILQRTVTLAELPAALDELRPRILADGLPPERIRVRLDVSPALPCGTFNQIVRTFYEAGLPRFQVLYDDNDVAVWLPLNLSAKRDEPQVIEVKLASDDEGNLIKLRMGERDLPGFTEFRAEVFNWLGDGTDQFRLELRADDQLQFKHLLEAWQRGTGYVSAGGKRIQLIRADPFDVAEYLQRRK